MAEALTIELLPAGNGDALWIEYGDPLQPRRILVDGGTAGTWNHALRPRIERVGPGKCHFEVVVVTHVDGDHIAGILPFFADEKLGVTVGDVWFNGWRHLPDTPLEALGPVQGEKLTAMLLDRELPWNEAFDRRAVGIGERARTLPRVKLEGGLTLTVLGPYGTQLAALKPVWREEVENAGLAPGVPPPKPPAPPPGLERLGALPDLRTLAATPFDEDAAPANGSSIVLLAEYGDRSVLLSADAHPSVIVRSVERLRRRRKQARLCLSACKVPHHGSRANVSIELVEQLDCPAYLFSTNGAVSHHPHPEAVARVAVAAESPELAFNYRSDETALWDRPALKRRGGYRTAYPAAEGEGLVVSCEATGLRIRCRSRRGAEESDP
jgi:hypothetical protein